MFWRLNDDDVLPSTSSQPDTLVHRRKNKEKGKSLTRLRESFFFV